MHAEHPFGLLVRWALANLRPAARPDLTLIRSRSNSARPDGAHELAACGVEIEAEVRLSQDTDFPAMEVVQRLDEVLRAATPSAQFGDRIASILCALARTLTRSGWPLWAPEAMLSAGDCETQLIRERRY